MTVIAICGPSGSGKDTASDFLVDKYDFTKIAFADPIKDFAQRIFGFTGQELYGPSHLRNKLDIRFTGSTCWYIAGQRLTDLTAYWIANLQERSGLSFSEEQAVESLYMWFAKLEAEHSHIGLSPRVVLQTLGTEWGRNVHEDLWVALALKKAENIERAVITDVRFNNELNLVKKFNGKLIRIFRDTEDVGILNHQSEEEMKSFPYEIFDAVIHNTGSLQDFLLSVDNVSKMLMRLE